MLPRSLFFLLLIVLSLACLPTLPEPEPDGGRPAFDPTREVPRPTPTVPTATGTAEVIDCQQPDDRITPQATPQERLIAPRGVQPPRALQPSILLEDQALTAQLVALLGEDAGIYSFFVKDLRTGRGATHNEERVFYSASLFKLFVMYEVFHQEEQDLLEWTDKLRITPYYEMFGLGPRATYLCQEVSVEEAIVVMTRISDNAAAVLLQDLVGSGNINQSLAALGLRESRLLVDDLPITAADVALLLEGIGRGQAVSQSASADMIRLMEGEAFDNGLAASLPGNVRFAHKTGNWSNATHEAGIVYASTGPYVIVVLAETASGAAKIEALSRRVFDYFSN